MYALRGILSFRLDSTFSGNCEPVEFLQDRVESLKESATTIGMDSEDVDVLHSAPFETLSLFVENVVVYIAGCVGRKVGTILTCDECRTTLGSIVGDGEALMLREDFILLQEQDKGALFKPSDELIRLCKLIEKVIRREQALGVLHITGKSIETQVKKECVGRDIFEFVHEVQSVSRNRATLVASMTHRSSLVSEIIRFYSKIRLHHIAKTYTTHQKSISKRQLYKRLHIHSGN